MDMITPDLSRAEWVKSTYSGGNEGNCVEVSFAAAGMVPVRDSKHPQGPTLVFSSGVWSGFVAFAAGQGSG